jgi:hypothetical protein
MYDNKIRLSQDVLEKAELIASEWGLKNVRAAVEAVFRRYADDYLHGRISSSGNSAMSAVNSYSYPPVQRPHVQSECEALNALDELLGL